MSIRMTGPYLPISMMTVTSIFSPLSPGEAPLRFFENQSGVCDEFDLVLQDLCWGDFYVNDSFPGVWLDSCNTGYRNREPGRGRTLTPLDYDKNGKMDLLLGKPGQKSLTLLLNFGERNSAYIAKQDSLFPHGADPVKICGTPSAFFLDYDRDLDRDLIIAPNDKGIEKDSLTIWFYENRDGKENFKYTRNEEENWLRHEAVDRGSRSDPAAFDRRYFILATGYRPGCSGVLPGRLLRYHTGDYRNVLVDSNFGNIDRYGLFGIAVDFEYLNDDGIPDMVLGDAEGRLYYSFLEDTGGFPVIRDLLPFVPAIDVGAFANPALADINDDGLVDMLVGERDGNLNYFQNYGTPDSPVFRSFPDDSFFLELDTREPGDSAGYSAPALSKSFNDNCCWQLELLLDSKSGKIGHFGIYRNGADLILYPIRLAPIHSAKFSSPCFKRVISDVDELLRPYFTDILTGTASGGFLTYSILWYEGIGDLEKRFELNIYPNPATDQITVELPGEMTYELKLFSMDGRLLRSRSVAHSRQSTLSLQGLPPGLYLLFVKSEGAYAVKKFVKN